MQYKIEKDNNWWNVLACWDDGDTLELESFRSYSKAKAYIEDARVDDVNYMMNQLFPSQEV